MPEHAGEPGPTRDIEIETAAGTTVSELILRPELRPYLKDYMVISVNDKVVDHSHVLLDKDRCKFFALVCGG